MPMWKQFCKKLGVAECIKDRRQREGGRMQTLDHKKPCKYIRNMFEFHTNQKTNTWWQRITSLTTFFQKKNKLKQRPLTCTFWILKSLENSHHNRDKLEKHMAEGGREAANAVLKHSKVKQTKCYTFGFKPDSSKDLLRTHSGFWEALKICIATEINLRSSWQREGGREAAEAVLKHSQRTNATLLVWHQTRTKTFNIRILDFEKSWKFIATKKLEAYGRGREGGCQSCSETFQGAQTLHRLLHARFKQKPLARTRSGLRRLSNSHPNRKKLEKLMAQGGREAAKAVLKHSKANKRYIARCTL